MTVETYKNLSGHSGVIAYKVGNEYIIVQFKDGRHTFYRYSSSSVGSGNLAHMKQLAETGIGLNSFISSNEHIKNGYDRRGNSLSEVE